jgi:flagellar biosynthetic protein FliR
VNELAAPFVLSAFAVFCRIGACIMVMPGLSSPRVPMRARLFVAIGLSLACLPLLQDRFLSLVADGSLAQLLPLFLFEIFNGLAIGLVSRFFFLMLEFLLSAVAQAIGLAGIAGMPIEENGGEPALVTLLMAASVFLFFLTDLHFEVLRGLILSYDIVAPGASFIPRLTMVEFTDALTGASLLALRLAGPFLVLSILVNFAFGLANKMTPMIQIYFAAMPVLIVLGFLGFALLAKPFLQGFVVGLSDYLVR